MPARRIARTLGNARRGGFGCVKDKYTISKPAKNPRSFDRISCAYSGDETYTRKKPRSDIHGPNRSTSLRLLPPTTIYSKASEIPVSHAVCVAAIDAAPTHHQYPGTKATRRARRSFGCRRPPRQSSSCSKGCESRFSECNAILSSMPDYSDGCRTRKRTHGNDGLSLKPRSSLITTSLPDGAQTLRC